MTTLRKTLVQAVEALEEVLAAERATNRPPTTVMEAEVKLDRIRSAVKQADSSIAALRTQIEALDKAKPVGYLHIEHFRGCKSLENANLDYVGTLPEGNYPLYTHPQPTNPLSDLLYSFAQDHAEQIGGAGKAEQVGELIAWIAGIEPW